MTTASSGKGTFCGLTALAVAAGFMALVVGCAPEKPAKPPVRPTSTPSVRATVPAADSGTTEALRAMVRRFGELVGAEDRILASRPLEAFYDEILPRRLLRSSAVGPIVPDSRLWLLDAADGPAAKALSGLKLESHVEPVLVRGYALLSYRVPSVPDQVNVPFGDFEGGAEDVFDAAAAIDYTKMETEKWWRVGQTSVVREPGGDNRQCVSLTYKESVPSAISPVLNVKGPTLCMATLVWRGNPLGRFSPSNVFRLLQYVDDGAGSPKPSKSDLVQAYIEPTPALFSEEGWNPLTLLWVLPPECVAVRLIVGLNYPKPPGRTILIDDVKFATLAP